MVHFITICKGRLKYLQQTIDTVVSQPQSRLIVVDYDCPDNTGDWVSDAYGDLVTVVKVKDRPLFSHAKARNIGFAHLPSGATWISFIDCDIKLSPYFFSSLPCLLENPPRSNIFFFGDKTSVTGTVLCKKESYIAVGGYDEVMSGYGHEDVDFYTRLVLSGVKPAYFPEGVTMHIEHTDEERVAHFACKDRRINGLFNRFYGTIKLDVMRMMGTVNLSQDIRQNLYDKCSITFIEYVNKQTDVPLEIELPPTSLVPKKRLPIQKKLIYSIKDFVINDL